MHFSSNHGCWRTILFRIKKWGSKNAQISFGYLESKRKKSIFLQIRAYRSKCRLYLPFYYYFFQSPPQKTKQAVLTAVRAGYRFIDCANDYDNEHVIGEALQQLFKEGVVQRSGLFTLR